VSNREVQQYKEPLVNVNKQLVEKDRILIEKYASRRNWDMQETETGLFYLIDGMGTGETARENDIVTITYQLSLLDGTLCYNTDSLGPESFVVGHEDVESGLDEGVRLMRKGDHAKLIIPPHLAHGLLGDHDKIPPRSIILFELEMVDIKRYEN
jgi:FKBP-type peptidyl-prolyl cis-trans isomerase